MIGIGFGFVGSPLATGVSGAPTPTVNSASTAAAAPALGRGPLSDGGQGAPILPLTPSAVPAIGDAASAENNTGTGTEDGERTPDNPQGLTEEEQRVVAELKRVDAEVRRHEQAHMNAGGQYAGQATYTYETGPDGGRYAVAGEVPIDTAPIPDDPEATIDKMEVVIRAALAPAEPSAQDQRVASGARQTIVAAQADLRAIERAEFEARLNGENLDAPGGADLNGPASAGSASGGNNAQALATQVYNAVASVNDRNQASESVAI